MKDVVAYCGLICDGCPIYWATNEEDIEVAKKMRSEIATLSNKLYDTKYCPDDIADCDGCITENGKLFLGCLGCHIRNCARGKNLPNCAYCSDYACESLDSFFKENAEAKLRLDFIKSVLE